MKSLESVVLVTAMVLFTTATGVSALAQTEVSLGTMRTELESAAIRLAVKTSQNLGDLSAIEPDSGKEHISDLVFSPDIAILTGESDAFNGVVAKFTGNLYPRLAVDTRENNIIHGQNFIVLPLSFGFESDRAFARLNTLGEAGVVPIWLHGPLSSLMTPIGVYFQVGYKSLLDSSASIDSGGSADQSVEEGDHWLARAKGNLNVNVNTSNWFAGDEGDSGEEGDEQSGTPHWPKFSLSGTLWYDIVNSEIYHRIETSIKIPITEAQDFDLKYEKGSGAPNFNLGDQFSANLSMIF